MNLQLREGERIPSSAADTRITYLGGYISLWSGLQRHGLVDKLRLSLYLLRSAPLKPHQKLNLLTTYILHISCIPQPSISPLSPLPAVWTP